MSKVMWTSDSNGNITAMKLRRFFVAGVTERSVKIYHMGKLSLYQCGPSSPPVTPVEQIASQPGTSFGYSMEIGSEDSVCGHWDALKIFVQAPGREISYYFMESHFCCRLLPSFSPSLLAFTLITTDLVND
ncbi:hypothetical protein DAPPUDRAFT_264222 [Daphnia pulex]|uniref:Uncharacterized protein n=1 Tax=Daphnia pulex TaxID=6669 RepID=E9HR42_DAPPU|nr:hypothetical protein DAPPUDRAFT_264222 [Daphnia pulex]|eukprot:EFX65767.1 hypothetical protein DAPPUDRAFT_264222 [Daphnia pulex]